jgi:hypothetical protein
MRLEFAEGQFDRVEVGRILREINQHRSRRPDRLRDAGDLAATLSELVADRSDAPTGSRELTILLGARRAESGKAVSIVGIMPSESFPLLSACSHRNFSLTMRWQLGSRRRRLTVAEPLPVETDDMIAAPRTGW